MSYSNFIPTDKRAVLGGLVTSILVGIGIFLVGNISGYQAKELLTSSLPGINTLCNTIVLASATILALLLTLLGVSSGSDRKLAGKHYEYVIKIARIDTILFITSLLFFQLFNLPVTESDSVPVAWFSSVYWATLTISAVLSGTMVSVILMLYGTIKNMVYVIGMEEDLDITVDDEED
ncbi:MAG: hypothetical protein HKN48_04035 [Flavobacteriaceae bacterium]|nr:hypothetical protein [Flavobacteriaceae bacterium]